jgi:hypothetical protein
MLGSVVNNALSPYIARVTYRVSMALWFGAFLSVLSVCCAVLLWWLDNDATRRIKEDESLVVAPSPPAYARFQPSPRSNASREGEQQAGGGGGGRFEQATAAAAAKAAVAAEDDHTSSLAWLPLPLRSICRSSANEVHSVMREVSKLPRVFWTLAFLCVVVYGTVLPFNNIASALLLDRDFFPQGSTWTVAGPSGEPTQFVFRGSNPPGVDCNNKAGQQTDFCRAFAKAQGQAAFVMSEPYTISAILCPFLGASVDRWGGRATLIIVSAMTLTLVHASLALTALPAQLLLFGLGLGYAVFASVIWPSIPLVVGRRQLGTAYGLCTALQNFGLFILPLAISFVLDLTSYDTKHVDRNPYGGVEIFLSCLGLSGVVAALMLNSQKAIRESLNAPRGAPLPSPNDSTVSSPLSSPVLRSRSPLIAGLPGPGGGQERVTAGWSSRPPSATTLSIAGELIPTSAKDAAQPR